MADTPSGPLLGYANHFYRNTGSYGSPTWVLHTNVGDCKVPLDAGEADATTRAGGGFDITEPGTFKLGLEFDALYDMTDTNLVALRTAFFARTAVEVLALDGPIATEGSRGIRFTGKVFGFPIDQPLSNMTKISVKIKPCLSANPPAPFVAPAP